MDSEALLQIVNDPRLTPEAVRLILAVAARGAGAHEIPTDELRVLLMCRSEKPIYAARDRAVSCGYLEWRQGGRGHANSYEYLASRAEVSADTSPPERRYPDSSSREIEEDTPPIIPLPVLGAEAERAIEQHGDLFEGTRKAMRDYVSRRVPRPSQSSHVQSVAGWLGGMGINWMGVPRAEWTGILAVAYNELGAVDESDYKSPTGDIRNLRNKLGALIQDRLRRGAPTKAQKEFSQRGRDKAADTQDYTPTEEWRGFNG